MQGFSEHQRLPRDVECLHDQEPFIRVNERQQSLGQTPGALKNTTAARGAATVVAQLLQLVKVCNTTM